jgi:restriction endonuclease S subunit
VSIDKILPEFLHWYLNQSSVENYLKRFSGRGVHMPVVKRAVLESIDIPLPQIIIQKQISELTTLLQREQELYKKLAYKRRKLMTQICLKATLNRD